MHLVNAKEATFAFRQQNEFNTMFDVTSTNLKTPAITQKLNQCQQEHSFMSSHGNPLCFQCLCFDIKQSLNK